MVHGWKGFVFSYTFIMKNFVSNTLKPVAMSIILPCFLLLFLTACPSPKIDSKDFRYSQLQRVERRSKELEAEKQCILKATQPDQLRDCRYAGDPERLEKARERRKQAEERREQRRKDLESSNASAPQTQQRPNPEERRKQMEKLKNMSPEERREFMLRQKEGTAIKND
jgi:hypothetical protein